MQPDVPMLLVFTLGAVRDSERRSPAPPGPRELEVGVRQACFDAAVAAGRACGCRVKVCSPERGGLPDGVEHLPQAGGDFGLRLERACAAARGRRRGPLLVVGARVPGLADRHLRQALALLAGELRRVVLGPSLEGGIYLLAAATPLPALGAVRWFRPTTLADLSLVLRAAGREVVLLEPLADPDRPADVDRLLAASKPARRRRPAGELPAPSAVAATDPAPSPGPSAPGPAVAVGGPPLADLLRRALAERRRPAAPEPPKKLSAPGGPRITGRAPPFSRLH